MLWGTLFGRLLRSSTTSSKSTKQRSNRLRAELLESRDVPATFFVTNGNDSGAGSLRDAIEQSQVILADADEIVIDPSVGVITLASPLPDLLESHTISATPTPEGMPGVFITPVEEQFQQFRFATFLPTAGVLTLRGIHLDQFGTNSINPLFDLNGGAINCWGNLQLYDCSITNCSSVGSGGALSVDKSLTVENCTITGNTAAGAGGGIYSASTSVVVWSITNSFLSSNTALGGSGGAIFLQTTDASGLTCTEVSFISNNAQGNGGAICMIEGHLSVINTEVTPSGAESVIAGNIARGVGGAIYTSTSSSVTIDCVYIEMNNMFQGLPGPPVANDVWIQSPTPTATISLSPSCDPFVIAP
jgi:hypothetical protein